MPKKDAATAVLGMLSTIGTQTRPTTAPVEPAPAPEVSMPEPVVTEVAPDTRPSASLRTLPPPSAPAGAPQDPAPRTIRLRADTARQLRAAWLEAKRDDVLLQSQDFASKLVEEALARRRRSRTASST